MYLSRGYLSLAVASVMLALASSVTARDPDGAVGMQAPTDESVAFHRRVMDYVQQFYSRAQRVVSLERVVLQPLDHGLQPEGRARRLEYEVRLEWQPHADGDPAGASVHRQLLRIDGRLPRRGDEPGCTDPRPLSPAPLAMLLPANQRDYVFSWPRASRRIDGRAARALDFRAAPGAPPPTMTWRDNCVTVDAPGKTAGRVWVDAASGVVLHLEERLVGQIDVPLPPKQRQVSPVRSMQIERADTTIRYKLVRFADPEEEMMLPASVDSVTVIRDSGTPRLRTTQTFSNYRRFVTGTRIVD